MTGTIGNAEAGRLVIGCLLCVVRRSRLNTQRPSASLELPRAAMATSKASQFANTGGLGENQNVTEAVDKYEAFHKGGWKSSNQMSYMDMVNKYYDLATSFYEFGWGESFHFAHRLTGESLPDSLKRHEHFLAAQGAFKKGDKVPPPRISTDRPILSFCVHGRAPQDNSETGFCGSGL